MPDVNLDVNYFDHIKTRKLVEALGDTADVYPLRLFCYCGKHYPTGWLPKHNAEDIERALDWRGEPGLLCRKLIEIGYLECSHRNGKSMLRVHAWLEHSGHIAAFRNRAKLAATERWRRHRESRKIDAQASPKQCKSTDKAMPPLTIPTIPTIPTNGTNHTNHTEHAGGMNGDGPGGPYGGHGMAGNGATGNLGMALDRSAKEASPKVLEALEKLRAEDAAKAQARGDPDWTRREKVCSILTAAGVDAPMALKLSGRRDLTEAGVSELVAKVRSSRAVRNLPAVIVARLTKKVGAL